MAKFLIETEQHDKTTRYETTACKFEFGKLLRISTQINSL